MHQDEPLKQWIPCRDKYLDELNCLEGRGQYTSDHCPSCSLILPSIIPHDLDLPRNRTTVLCRDCFGKELVCMLCCVHNHAHNPLHIIEVHRTIISFCAACLLVFLQKWNGSYLEPTTLADIGLCIQLGHPPGKSCSNPHRGYDEFTVIHTNGLHHVHIDYCECDLFADYGSHRQQLLQQQWYPATHNEPQTCAMFALLKHFHMQNLQGKVAGYDYYSALEKLMDNTGMSKIKVGDFILFYFI